MRKRTCEYLVERLEHVHVGFLALELRVQDDAPQLLLVRPRPLLMLLNAVAEAHRHSVV